MANHRLGGINLYLARMISQSKLNGLCFKQIVVVGAGSVGIDIINIRRHKAGVLYGVFHGPCGSAPVLCRGSDMVSVAGSSVASYLTVNLCPSL